MLREHITIMAEFLFTISDIAKMTMLSERTIRTYIKGGRLSGEKINGKWLFLPENLEDFFADGFVRRGLRIRSDAHIGDFVLNRKKSAAALCAILDKPVGGHDEAAAFSDKALAAVNEAKGIFMAYIYDKGMIRLTLIGEPETVSSLLAIIARI